MNVISRQVFLDPFADITPEQIHTVLTGYYDYFDRIAVIKNCNASPENIDVALDDTDSYVREAAIRNPNVTVDNVNKALQDKLYYIRHIAAEIKEQRGW
jgi:hypothetical protein